MRRALIPVAACLLLSCAPAARTEGPAPGASSGTGTKGTATASDQPGFQGTVSRLDPATRKRVRGSSWHENCPVPLYALRLLHLNNWGFDHEVHQGEMVVRTRWARPVLEVFGKLFRAKFPIHRVALADVYRGDDHKLMKANITSAFNCRRAEGSSAWSEHAYGRAIDLNPVQNPYVSGDTVLPPAGERYLNRKKRRPGMVHAGDVAVRAFASIGWKWGGHFHSLKDYQHFSSTGR